MKKALMNRGLLIIGMLLAACSDPTSPPAEPDPCAEVFACRFPGVDLEVVSASVTADATDPQTMLPIVQPAAVRVGYTIRNRGRVAVPAGVVWLNLVSANGHDFSETIEQQQPGLAPGETHSGSALIPTGSLQGVGLRDDRMTAKVSVWASEDTVVSNNVMSSALFHLAVPLLDLSFTAEPNAVIGQPIALSIIARNYGLHAEVPAQSLTGCLYDGFGGCRPEYRTTTGAIEIPRVPAGSAVQFNTTMVIPPSAAWQDAYSRYTMYLCAGQPATYNVGDSVRCVSSSRTLWVRPDYASSCAPPALTAGMAVTLATYNCGLRPTLAGFETQTLAYRFHLVSLEAESNVTYALQRSDTTSIVRIYDAQGNAVYDLDAAPERIRVEAAQRLYLVMYSATESIAITATRAVNGAL